VIDPQVVKEAVKRKKARKEEFLGFEYLRFSDDFQDIPRGTVIFPDAEVHGYPHIGRIFMLERGIREQFREPFWVEEKVDGFNVRIFKTGGRTVALSRGGYICPFTTDRLVDFIPEDFFRENPDLVLCCEVAGPENPYIEEHPPYVNEDVRFFVFDIMEKGSGDFLSQEEKLRLIEKYSLPSVEIFGRFDHEEVKELKSLLLRLDREGREGVVLKEDAGGGRRAKYITERANLSDIKITAGNMLQLPAEYYTNRILRIVLFMEEEGIERTSHLYEELGRAFIDGLFSAIEQFKREGRVSREFRCRFRTKEMALAQLDLLHRTSRHIQVLEKSLKKEGEYWVLTFDKVFLNMTGLLGHLLGGGLVFD
jgi:putative ATP-dependent DNA ligase